MRVNAFAPPKRTSDHEKARSLIVGSSARGLCNSAGTKNRQLCFMRPQNSLGNGHWLWSLRGPGLGWRCISSLKRERFMKKLALLLLTLSLAACATPQQVSQMRERQYMTAEAHCRADNVDRSAQYGKCI